MSQLIELLDNSPNWNLIDGGYLFSWEHVDGRILHLDHCYGDYLWLDEDEMGIDLDEAHDIFSEGEI